MVRSLCLVLLAALSLFGGKSSSSPVGRPERDVTTKGLTELEKSNILARHNMHRGDVSPTASDMVQLQWDDEIARDAQEWANQCRFEHNPSEDRRTDRWPWVGQNMAMGYGHSLNVYIDMWNDEEVHYDYDSNSCDRGQVCGHYTQVAWADTKFIGCGWTDCGSFDIFACHYGPGGNYIGQRPYESGTSCSRCPFGYRGGCSDNLCKMG